MTQIPNLICGVELEVGQNDTSSQYKHKCFYMEEMKKMSCCTSISVPVPQVFLLERGKCHKINSSVLTLT